MSPNDIPPSRESPSSARLWRPLARFIASEAGLADWASRRPLTRALYEFVRFGVKQA